MNRPQLSLSPPHYLQDLQELSDSMRKLLETLQVELTAPTGRAFDHASRVDFPDIRLRGSAFIVGGIHIACSGRPLTLQLLSAFFEGGAGTRQVKVDRETILQHVYRETKLCSERMHQSYDVNLNKLISRTRRFIHESLLATPWSKNIEWLVFDHKEKVWSLLMMNPAQARLDRPSHAPYRADVRQQLVQEALREDCSS